MKWKENEINLLKQLYPTASMENLLNAFPGRSYKAISTKAGKLGISANECRRKKTDLSYLDLDNLTCESLYWWGFIMADGHMTIRSGLTIQLDVLDKDHLQKLATKLNASLKIYHHGYSDPNRKETDLATLHAGDKTLMEKWFSKFKMENTAKTYFPPDLSIFMTRKNLIYFLIGFIDGDGSIEIKDKKEKGISKTIKIVGYKTWKPIWEAIAKKCLDFYDIKINIHDHKENYVVCTIYSNDSHLSLLSYLQKVPYLSRKWNKLIKYYGKNIQ